MYFTQMLFRSENRSSTDGATRKLPEVSYVGRRNMLMSVSPADVSDQQLFKNLTLSMDNERYLLV